MRAPKIIISFFMLLSVSVEAQKLSREEAKIIRYIDAQMPQTLQLLEEVVNINSGTLHVTGVRQTGERLAEEFKKIGFITEWVALPDSLKRAGHLVAYTKGKKGKKLFLIGHLDTVFEPFMPPNPYKVINDSTATGQGINDMKGGNVLIVAALKALHHNGLLKDVTITAYFTGDEEKAGHPIEVTRGDFIERAKKHEIALGFETAQGLHTVATARRGSSSWQLKVEGRQAHSSGIFTNGYGAVYEAARIVNAFREELSREKYLTFNPGFFIGGSEMDYDSGTLSASVTGKLNIISPAAIVQGDLRFLTESQKEAARLKMKRIAEAGNLPGTRAQISFADGITSMEPTPGNAKLVTLLNQVSKDMGIGETKAGDPGNRGAGDISYVAKYLHCLDGLGASGRGAHAPGETIHLKEYPDLIKRAALLIYRLTR